MTNLPILAYLCLSGAKKRMKLCHASLHESKWEEREARQLPAYTTHLAPMQPLRNGEEEKREDPGPAAGRAPSSA